MHLSLRLRCTKNHCHILVENSLICKKCKKKEEIWLSPIIAPTATEKYKKQRDNTKMPPKNSITQRLGTDLTRSVGVVLNSLKIYKLWCQAKYNVSGLKYRISGIFRVGKFWRKCRLEGVLNFHRVLFSLFQGLSVMTYSRVYFSLCLFLAISGRSRTQRKLNPRENFPIYGSKNPKTKSRKCRGVSTVKSRAKTRQVRENWSQQLEHKQVPKCGTEPGGRKGKRALLACQRFMETIPNLVKVKFGIKVMELVEKLIVGDVTVTGQGSECHLTFVGGRLHIFE